MTLAEVPTADQIILPSLIVIALLVLGFVVALQVKRRLQRADESGGAGAAGGFTLSDLRQLHKSGQMSDEEFERAKAQIVAAARRVAERDAAKPQAAVARAGATGAAGASPGLPGAGAGQKLPPPRVETKPPPSGTGGAGV